MEKREVRGIEIAYDFRNGSNDLIVFIHGVGADRSGWKFQMDYFHEQGFSVLSVDMRGSGDSQSRFENGLLVPISLTEFALDVNALVQSLGFRNAHWVGNSMGGVIIQEAWRLGLETVQSAVLCNTFAKHPDSAQILPRASTALRTKSLEEFSRERIPAAMRKDIAPDILEEAIYAMSRKDPEAYLASWRATWSPDFRKKLAGVTVPVLIITGTEDKLTPPALGKELYELLPNFMYIEIEDAGHLSFLDKTDEFNSVVFDFLQQQLKR